MRTRAAVRMFALGVAAVVLVAQSAMAQSTIFNIPTTDTVAVGSYYGEFDLLPQFPGPDEGASIIIFNPRLVVGLPHDVEVGVNVPIYRNSDADPTSLAYIQPNLKWKFFRNDDMGLAASAGAVVNTPLNEREGQGTWSYIYGNLSKKITGAKGPRVTVGGFGVIADQDSGKATYYGKKGGVLVGYEQPLSGRISLVADWFSGKNSIGYFTPGISIVLPRGGLFNAGYSFGNDSFESPSNNNRFLFLYYGVTW